MQAISGRTGCIIFRVQCKWNCEVLGPEMTKNLKTAAHQTKQGALLSAGPHVIAWVTRTGGQCQYQLAFVLCSNVGSASMSSTLTSPRPTLLSGPAACPAVPTGSTCSFCLLESRCPDSSNYLFSVFLSSLHHELNRLPWLAVLQCSG